MKPEEKPSVLKVALQGQRPALHQALFFSVFINLLALAPVLYMFQVYDRVVSSRSTMTLAMLTVLMLVALAIMEILERVRTSILDRAGLDFDARIGERAFDATFEANLRNILRVKEQGLNDLATVRSFFSSPVLLGLIDVPLALTYLLAIIYINPYLGLVSIFGALLQFLITGFTERDTQPLLTQSSAAVFRARSYVQATLRNSQVIEAMGMLGNIYKRWLEHQQIAMIKQAVANEKSGKYASLAKFMQTFLASFVLGLGCWLVIRDLMPAMDFGLILVASILGGKVLTPMVRVISGWKQVVAVRDAYHRLERLVETIAPRPPGMPLPPPQGRLTAEAVTATAPGSNAIILRNVSFTVPAGTVLAIIGPSASGKSSLARLLVGVWPSSGGKVRLDGADVYSWNKAELGPYVGYLPQEVELFSGTISENIARFGIPDPAQVEAAARLVGIHEDILALPDGYDSAIGDDGCFLSGGQRQRVGLARAVYGDPRFVVLDEPNSNLDEVGELALLNTIRSLKERGATVVVIAHRSGILAVVDQMLVLVDGQVRNFGPRQEVLAALQQRAAPATAATGVAKA